MKKANVLDLNQALIEKLTPNQLHQIHEMTNHTPPSIDPMALTREDINTHYGDGYSIVKHGDLFYQVNANTSPPVYLIEDDVSNKTYGDTLIEYFSTNQSTNSSLSIIRPNQSITATDESPDRLLSVFNLIKAIALHAQEHH